MPSCYRILIYVISPSNGHSLLILHVAFRTGSMHDCVCIVMHLELLGEQIFWPHLNMFLTLVKQSDS